MTEKPNAEMLDLADIRFKLSDSYCGTHSCQCSQDQIDAAEGECWEWADEMIAAIRAAAPSPHPRREEPVACRDPDCSCWFLGEPCELAAPPPAGADAVSDQYLVWSNQHRGWWRPNSAGYTSRLDAAGRYSREEAIDISRGQGWSPKGVPDEVPVREQDAIECFIKTAQGKSE